MLKKRLSRSAALLFGVMLVFVLVGCDDSAGGGDTWGGGNQPGGSGSTPQTFTVSFNANGGSGTTPSITGLM